VDLDFLYYRVSRTFADAKQPIIKPQIQKIKMRRGSNTAGLVAMRCCLGQQDGRRPAFAAAFK
jgi:hypothetical protein